MNIGTHLFSHAVPSIVPSAVRVLTVVFGMGTGVSPGCIGTDKAFHKDPYPDLYEKNKTSLPRITDSTHNPYFFLRKEVIQPHLPIRLPCYDFTPVISPAFGSSLRAVGSLTSGVADSHGVTGGVYKTRERIHRDMLIRDY